MSENTFFYKSSKDRKSNTNKILFKGDLGIRNAAGIKKKLNGAKITGDKVKIKIEDVENMDITFVQLISSLKDDMEKQGKAVSVQSELTENLEKLIANSGLMRILNTENK